MPRFVVLLVALSACGGSGCSTDAQAELDLSAVADLSGKDLSSSRDLASSTDLACPYPGWDHVDMAHGDLAWNMCSGTPLEGTCVAAFFDSFAACFAPAGSCRIGFSNEDTLGTWANGASYSGAGMFNHTSAQFEHDGAVCLQTYAAQPDDGLTHFTSGKGDGSDPPATDAGMQAATYDENSGVFTCPEGTSVTIGPDLGGCAALNALLAPTWMCGLCPGPQHLLGKPTRR